MIKTGFYEFSEFEHKLAFSQISVRFGIDNRHQITTLVQIILDTLFSLYLHEKIFQTKTKPSVRCTYIPVIVLAVYFFDIPSIKLGKVKTMNTCRSEVSFLSQNNKFAVFACVSTFWSFWCEHRVTRILFSKYLINEKEIKSKNIL